jgi:hypothetical protein
MFRRMTSWQNARERETAALLLPSPYSCSGEAAVRQKSYIVRPDVNDVRLVFAHRAFCASFLRSAAEIVRFGLFGVQRISRNEATRSLVGG